eukprot:EG_transcript_51913
MTEGLPGSPRGPSSPEPADPSALRRVHTDPFPLNDVRARTELLRCLSPPLRRQRSRGTDSPRVDLRVLPAAMAAAVAALVAQAALASPPPASPRSPRSPSSAPLAAQ